MRLIDSRLRVLPKPHLEVLLDYIDSCQPGLKGQISNLSAILPGLVDYGILPSQRLVLEIVPTSEWLDIGDRRLEELFQYSVEDAELQGVDSMGTGPCDAMCSSEQGVCWDSGFKLVPGAVLDSAPAGSGQLPSPIAGMDSGSPSCSAMDISGYARPSIDEGLWAGDCEFTLNPGAVEAKNNLTVSARVEEYHLPPASRLDNEFLLSPLVMSQGMMLL
jgi:hypothetical protein